MTRALGVTLEQPLLGVGGEEGPHLVTRHQRVPGLGEQRVQVQLRAGVGAGHQAPLVVGQNLAMGGRLTLLLEMMANLAILKHVPPEDARHVVVPPQLPLVGPQLAVLLPRLPAPDVHYGLMPSYRVKQPQGHVTVEH